MSKTETIKLLDPKFSTKVKVGDFSYYIADEDAQDTSGNRITDLNLADALILLKSNGYDLATYSAIYKILTEPVYEGAKVKQSLLNANNINAPLILVNNILSITSPIWDRRVILKTEENQSNFIENLNIPKIAYLVEDLYFDRNVKTIHKQFMDNNLFVARCARNLRQVPLPKLNDSYVLETDSQGWPSKFDEYDIIDDAFDYQDKYKNTKNAHFSSSTSLGNYSVSLSFSDRLCIYLGGVNTSGRHGLRPALFIE